MRCSPSAERGDEGRRDGSGRPGDRGGAALSGLPSALRRALVLGPPLALAVLEVFHPRPDENAQAVVDAATWFFAFFTPSSSR
jgi:hypothetical protein